MKVLLEIEIDEEWGEEELLNSMTDVELLELFEGDLLYLLENAKWKIIR